MLFHIHTYNPTERLDPPRQKKTRRNIDSETRLRNAEYQRFYIPSVHIPIRERAYIFMRGHVEATRGRFASESLLATRPGTCNVRVHTHTCIRISIYTRGYLKVPRGLRWLFGGMRYPRGCVLLDSFSLSFYLFFFYSPRL